jgi:DNA-binding LacI/PurR family transcriptional regulator
MGDTSRRSPTMYDVAERAGVSHQTVSRVLNGFASIRPETRDRVLVAIAELGYRRNSAARTLVTARTRAIGVLAPAVVDYGPTTTVQAIEMAARAAGYYPLVTTAAADPASIRDALGFLLDHAVEALVVIAPQESVLDAMSLLDITLPVATLQSTRRGQGVVISVDQRAGADAAIRHLLGLGHRAVQHLAGPSESLEATMRRAAYVDAMTAAGLRPMPEIPGDWTAASGYVSAASIDPATTAVFSGNDQMALGLIRGLAERGRRVPTDVSVVGFDDLPEARFFSPPLTTVRQDFHQVGRIAVEALIRQIEGERPVEVPAVTPELVVRESTGAPRH